MANKDLFNDNTFINNLLNQISSKSNLNLFEQVKKIKCFPIFVSKKIKLPNIPISFNQERLGVNRDLPRQGEHTYEILSEIGISPDQIDNLLKLL